MSTETPTSRASAVFTISVLNSILPFAASDAQDALGRLAAVNSVFNEAVHEHAARMWKVLMEKRWPTVGTSKGIRGRVSKQAYMMRHLTGLRRSSDFNDIEGCTESDFAFLCPMLLENMSRTGEFSSVGNLPVLHCDVCDKHVYPVTRKSELEAAAAKGQCVRYVALNEQSAVGLQIHSKSMDPALRSVPSPPQRLSMVVHLNVAVAVPDTPEGAEHGAQFLRGVQKRLAPAVNRVRFLSRDLLVMSTEGTSALQEPRDTQLGDGGEYEGKVELQVVVVRLPAPAADGGEGGSSINEEYVKSISDDEKSPLGRSSMPQPRGWQRILMLVPWVVPALHNFASAIQGTVVGALLGTGNVQSGLNCDGEHVLADWVKEQGDLMAGLRMPPRRVLRGMPMRRRPPQPPQLVPSRGSNNNDDDGSDTD